jgi:hypothetical protein
MELDLETFLTTLYVMVDDLYQQHIQPYMPARSGPVSEISDSEVLCLGLAAQWRSGVPWQTERGFVRYTLAHLRPLFPGMTSQSAFNRRLRRLWGAYILIQQAVAEQLWIAQDCEIMDCVPVPIARGARSFHPGWLEDIARIGKGGNDRYFYGLHLLLVISRSGVVTGWTLAAGNVQDRWLAELLLSSRAGSTQLSGPQDQGPEPPTDWVGPAQSCGAARHCPILPTSATTVKPGTNTGPQTMARRSSPLPKRNDARPGSGSAVYARSSKQPSPACATALASSSPELIPVGGC